MEKERTDSSMRKTMTLFLSIWMILFLSPAGWAEESAEKADRIISFEESSYIVYVGRQLSQPPGRLSWSGALRTRTWCR